MFVFTIDPGEAIALGMIVIGGAMYLFLRVLDWILYLKNRRKKDG